MYQAYMCVLYPGNYSNIMNLIVLNLIVVECRLVYPLLHE